MTPSSLCQPTFTNERFQPQLWPTFCDGGTKIFSRSVATAVIFFFIISETFSGNKNTKIITTPTVPSGCNRVYDTRYDISTIGAASNILARVRYLNLHSMLARVHARRKIRHACANGLVTTSYPSIAFYVQKLRIIASLIAAVR